MQREWHQTIIPDSVDNECWSLLGFSAEKLDERFWADTDSIVGGGEMYIVYRYKNTNILYQIVENGSGKLKLNAVWREESEL